MKILVTGATGYVGAHLLRTLDTDRNEVRCLARIPEYLHPPANKRVEIVRGDVLDQDTLPPALSGIEVAYYLIHSMGAPVGFDEVDRKGAENFAAAARSAGVKKIIYLGGLGGQDLLSRHLQSRQEVGRILSESGVPTIEFRSSLLIGNGSLAFELIRSLVNRLLMMITPAWVRNRTQPIWVKDAVSYLAAAADLPLNESRIYEIGGPDITTYEDLMREYATQVNKRRFIIPVPWLTPKLSALWLRLVTPLYYRVGEKIIDSVKNETIIEDPSALSDFPIRPIGFREAIAESIKELEDSDQGPRWFSSRSSYDGGHRRPLKLDTAIRFEDVREMEIEASPADAIVPLHNLGGSAGWYAFNSLWYVRGLIDLFVGGVGMRRGRPRLPELRSGDVIDFWRVVESRPERLELLAEMKVPGEARLRFEIQELPNGHSLLRQTAQFLPAGVLGRVYWYSLVPLHGLIFSAMVRNIARHAEGLRKKRGGSDDPAPAGGITGALQPKQ